LIYRNLLKASCPDFGGGVELERPVAVYPARPHDMSENAEHCSAVQESLSIQGIVEGE
jgi:hypothetical protein